MFAGWLRRAAPRGLGGALAVAWLIAGLLLVPVSPGRRAIAAPAHPLAAEVVRRVTPDWISAGTAARLDLGFDVLVPAHLPAPISGAPQVETNDGAYSLYWMKRGGAPTFLQVAGAVGGQIPAYSEYDRNNQLTINARVQGHDAYHDLTPVYDLVYWRAGDIAYSVNSRNLSDTDTLSVADALEVLKPSSNGDGGNNGLGVEATAPPSDATAPPADTSANDATAPPASGAGGDPVSASLSCPDTVVSGQLVYVTLSGSGRISVDARAGKWTTGSPNTDFDPSGGGGEIMTGTIPDSGQATLAWRVPTVQSPLATYIFANDLSGNTLSECDVTINPGTPPPDATQPPAVAPAPTAVATAGGGVTGAAYSATQPATTTSGSLMPSVAGTGAASTAVATSVSSPTIRPVHFATVTVTRTVPRPATPAATPVSPATPPPPTPMSPPPAATPTASPVVPLAAKVAGAVAAVVGPAGGQVVNPRGATLTIPAGALTGATAVTIAPVPDPQLPVSPEVDLIPGSGFDVTFSGASGQPIEQVSEPVTLRLALSANQWRDGAAIYRVNGSTLERVGGSRLDRDGVTAPLSHFSRYVVGTPSPTATASRNLFRWLLIAIGGLAAVTLFGAVVASTRPRRPRSARRPPPGPARRGR